MFNFLPRQKPERETKEAVRVVTLCYLKKNGNLEYMTITRDTKGEEQLPLSDIVKSKVIEECGNEVKSITW